MSRPGRRTSGSRLQRQKSCLGALAEALESRTLMTAAIDPLPTIFGTSITLPAGKSIQVPLTSTGATGTVTYTVAVSNPSLIPLINSISPGVASKRTFIKMSTSLGDLVFQLFNDVAPLTVAHLLNNLSSPDYVNSIFHRIIKDAAGTGQGLSIVQGGDRDGDGQDNNVGLAIEQELDPRVLYTGHGQLAEARTSQPDTGGSQFFVTLSNQRFLDFNYTVFGQLVSGWDKLTALNDVPTSGSNGTPADRPLTPPTLNSIQVITDVSDAVLTLVSTSKTPLTGTITVTAKDSTGTSQRVFNVTTVTDTVDDPPFLAPPSKVNRGIQKNTKTIINFGTAVDLEGSAYTIGGSLVSNPAHFAGQLLTPTQLQIVPETGYTGPIQVIINAKQNNNQNITTSRTYTFYVDSGAGPTGTLTAKDLVQNAGAVSTFTVTYTDASPIDLASITSNKAVSVFGPNGFARFATFVSVKSNDIGTTRTVTYALAAPGGSWEATDAGAYLVLLNAAAIKDTAGNFAKVATIGKFYYSPSFLFDERYYLATNPTVAQLVASGVFKSGWAHFQAVGQTQGRSPSPFFNEGFYRAIYPDVAAAIAAKQLKSGWQHFLAVGIKEGRYSSPVYNEKDYLRMNPDIAAAVTAKKFTSGLEHFILAGQFENRKSSLYYDVTQYIQNNPDVVAAVTNHTAGMATSVTLHFLLAGQKEGRVANDLYNESYYLSTNPDVAQAVSTKFVASGFEHFVISGARQNRNPSTLFDSLFYLANNPTAAAAVATGQLTAFQHYMLTGRDQGLPAHA